MKWTILTLLGTIRSGNYGDKFIRIYPAHSPTEKFGIFTYICSKRLQQIAKDKLSANEQALKL